MGKLFKIGCSTILILMIVVITVFIVSVDKDDNASEKGSSTNSSSSKSKYETTKELTTFEGVKVSFVELVDPEAGVTVLTLKLRLENNSDKEVTVMLTDGYVNDTKVQFMTGLPVKIASGKKAVGAFVFGYDGLGFSKVEDIEKMEFKIQLYDEEYDFETSNTIALKFK